MWLCLGLAGAVRVPSAVHSVVTGVPVALTPWTGGGHPTAARLAGSVLRPGPEPGLLQRKPRILTTGPPGNPRFSSEERHSSWYRSCLLSHQFLSFLNVPREQTQATPPSLYLTPLQLPARFSAPLHSGLPEIAGTGCLLQTSFPMLPATLCNSWPPCRRSPPVTPLSPFHWPSQQPWTHLASLTLEAPSFLAIFCRCCFIKLLSCVRLFATPWTAAHQASLSITSSQSLLKLMSIESVMASNHLILRRPLLLLPPIPPSITFHFHALEKAVATHSSVLAWRIPGTGEPGGLQSMGLHRVGHD